MTYIVCLATTKGGAGKTTTIEVVGAELRRRGYSVLGLDADPERRLKIWADLRADPNFVVLDGINETNIDAVIETHAAQFDFVFVDLAGFGNLTMIYAFGKSDLVLIPSLASAMDRDATLRTYQVAQAALSKLRHAAPAIAFLNRTPPAIRLRVIGHLRTELEQAGVPLLPIELIERSQIVETTWHGKGPTELPADSKGAENAAGNVVALTDAILAELQKVELNPFVPRKAQQSALA
jgi:chromosome partitioning protein